MKTHKFACHCCDNKSSLESDQNYEQAARAIKWKPLIDTSNGATLVFYCPDCFSRMSRLAKELKELVKLDHFHFNSLLKG